MDDDRSHSGELGCARTPKIGGIATSRMTEAQLLAEVENYCLTRRNAILQGESVRAKTIYSTNGQIVSDVGRNTRLRDIIAKGDIVHADGMSVVMASRLFGSFPLPERIAMTDFFHTAATMAVEKKLSFFLLGGTDRDNRDCARKMAQMYPGLKIAGRDSSMISNPADEARICQLINDADADIVWVGLGFPKQMEFCDRNLGRIHASWLITCGGCFSYVTGSYKRAPKWLQRIGFEWLFRMLTQPKRVFWRYMSTNFRALWLFATQTDRKSSIRN